MDGHSVIPPPLDGDDDDVAWALQTAAVQWQRGARADAVVWLRRAVESAITAGNPERTRELTVLAANVADRLVAEAMAAPDSMAPPSGGSSRSDVDDLLDSAPAPAPSIKSKPRASQHSLTGEIPVDFDEEDPDEDDFDHDAQTIPPASLDAGPARTNFETDLRDETTQDYDEDEDEDEDEEHIVSADELFSARPGAPSHPSLTADELFSNRPGVVPDSIPPGDEPFGLADGPVPSVHPPSVHPPSVHSPSVHPPSENDAVGDTEERTGPPIVGGVSLEDVRGFEDLPEESQASLARLAVLTSLGADEEVASFGAALVTHGKVGIMPSIADVASSVATQGEIVFTRGTLEDSVALRVVALEEGTVVASWSVKELESSMADCPWVADELRLVADKFQAYAGATLGPLGDRLDDALREMVMSRLEVRAFGAGEVIVTAGKAVPGLHIVGAGRVDLEDGDGRSDAASPGDFLFAAEVLAGGKAHVTARAGKSGALILFATRAVAHELLMSVPPLLEILAG